MKIKFNNSTIQQFNNRGFTLIELIVVFSVMAVLSVVGIASFASYSRSQVLQQATTDLVNTLNTAKVRAASQIKPSILQCNNGILESYKVVINDPSANKYTLYAVCSGSSVGAITTTLPLNVSFNSAVVKSITYPVLTGGVNGSGDVVLSSYAQTKTVKISLVGGISVQ